MSSNQIIAVIVAGGRGARARTSIPKQYASIGGVSMLRRTVLAFAHHPRVDGVQVVIGETDHEQYALAVEGIAGLRPPVVGGTDRQASVREGLRALQADDPSYVLIHDGARPFVSSQTIDRVIDALSTAEGAIAALPVADTLKRETTAGGIAETVSRYGLWRAQTPQGFRYATIRAAHEDAEPGIATDDASLLERQDIHVSLVPDEPTNIKVTFKEDFQLAEMILSSQRETRIGMGYDVHQFEAGDYITLGGIDIPHTHKLKGHSDADAVLHAITDALYGTIAAGDIGQHFPPSDEQWRGAASDIFLKHAAKIVRDKGGRIVNVDLTIICEAPKIGPHRNAMAERIAALLEVAPSRVAIKATTTEQLGFTGRREGLACQAIVSVQLPMEA
ncbi:bifunctional 2-C-methyl-D-erythritol 4-phosphate cytidylyltransferase/2-C-methyl-D-erythritol 2,4-cyclodiphosphate synthase [Parvularcula sp. LCG005]|uniref:bifunctional 2-C-methyl-D-erythritol 4-phosphate cytidylyltransferase/2-C-methyl-D-erythritol 2,4-cyclodiphosphate synthase n=1 Tax=Parvularcula sp. LCG005 TaxID=3078805 RepID=UPI0029422206|nr:bifunctional 2-C-methyl-D-erythritol 4-phosphate cytidylyltransferase/2-C-methyl-D-erythritol 2,4-cyclodiphosphate synthase [Parvularcula sp. LCG005]WOI54449.1 bifunctional 2-C-methyl-D-erythritol 4-phosphate cytidylyltransferase/2-C-methyl-D-erythritol 2,4-cyclodiphosphate synthase [Parvularcula sp. LCG005]